MGYDIMETQFARWQEKAQKDGLTAQEVLAVNAGTNTPVDKIIKTKELLLRAGMGSAALQAFREMMQLVAEMEAEHRSTRIAYRPQIEAPRGD